MRPETVLGDCVPLVAKDFLGQALLWVVLCGGLGQC